MQVGVVGWVDLLRIEKAGRRGGRDARGSPDPALHRVSTCEIQAACAQEGYIS